MHTDIDQETEEIIADVLGVEVRLPSVPASRKWHSLCDAFTTVFAPRLVAHLLLCQSPLRQQVFRQTIAGQILVGTYCKFTNQGGLVHPGVSVEDLDELSSLLQARNSAWLLAQRARISSQFCAASHMCSYRTSLTMRRVVGRRRQLISLITPSRRCRSWRAR